MNKIKSVLTTGAMLAIAAGSANASTLTYWYNIFGPTPDPTQVMTAAQATTVNAGTTSTLQITKFDETILGDPAHKNVLTDVGMFVNWAATGSVKVINFDSAPHSFVNGTAAVTMSLSGPSPSFPTTLNIPTMASAPAGTVAPFTLAMLDPANRPSWATSGTGTSQNHVGINNLGFYEGNGIASLAFNTGAGSATYGGTETDGNGDLYFSGTAQVGGILQVVYTFDTVASGVPEPATMTTLGSALIALSLIARKFSNKRS